MTWVKLHELRSNKARLQRVFDRQTAPTTSAALELEEAA